MHPSSVEVVGRCMLQCCSYLEAVVIAALVGQRRRWSARWTLAQDDLHGNEARLITFRMPYREGERL